MECIWTFQVKYLKSLTTRIALAQIQLSSSSASDLIQTMVRGYCNTCIAGIARVALVFCRRHSFFLENNIATMKDERFLALVGSFHGILLDKFVCRGDDRSFRIPTLLHSCIFLPDQEET